MSREHELTYNSERSERWELAEKLEKETMAKVLEKLRIVFPEAKSCRYDKNWFEYAIPEANDWVRGVSDYVVALSKEEGIFAEIKIKRKLFRKTKFGGTTANGSIIPKYGCESAYLDVQPVFSNINQFLDMFAVPKESFFFFFASTEDTQIRTISVAEVEALIETGYNGVQLCTFGEGYGTKTENGRAICYLIPIDAMHVLGENDKEYFKGKTTSKIIFPMNFLKLACPKI